MRTHPISGDQRFHSGIDIVVPGGSDDNVRTIAGGRVLYAGNPDPNGFGVSVIVRTPDGFIEQYSHLEWVGVNTGEIIQPGTSVGKMGSTGASTGAHLHFTVYRPEVPDDGWMRGNYEQVTISPLDYMQMTHTLQVLPRGVGAASLPLASTPAELQAIQEFVAGVEGRQAQTVNSSNNASPQRTPVASAFRSDYIKRNHVNVHNDPANNYGYEAIGTNRAYRVALARAASALNIPAVWLADVIAFETGNTHSTSVTNPLGCVGLIQFCPDTGLADLAQDWGVSQYVAAERLKQMTHATQLQVIVGWLARYSNGGRDLNTIEDLYALINGGVGLLQDSAQRQTISDSFVSGAVSGGGRFVDHVANLGKFSGRVYSDGGRLRGGVGATHISFVQGCRTCQNQMENQGTISPHIPPSR